MSFTSRDAARIRFRGTRFAYDRAEVDEFHREVVVALAGYEAALEEAEEKLTRLNRANRGLNRAGRGDGEPRVAKAATPSHSATADDPLTSFHRWRAELAAQLEVQALLDSAREEAAMIRETTAVRASDEIERLTAAARDEARAITKRAALLAADTEEAARRRAGEILEGSDRAEGWDRAVGAAEMQVLSERIVRLRSSIADVQGRLESLSGDEGAVSGGEIIDLDLRDVPEDSKPSSKRSRRRPKVAAIADAEITTESLEAKMAELKRKLAAD